MSYAYRACAPDDLPQLAALRAEAFRKPLDAARWLKSGRVIGSGDAVQAALRMLPAGQWFGGRPVPTRAIRGVAVDLLARGTGVGRALLAATLGELASEGVALATLYPSSVRFYRQLGFELAGVTTRYRAALPPRSGAPTHSLQPWTAADLEAVAGAYNAWAGASSGLLQRPADWWDEQGLLADPPSGRHGYAAWRGAALRGYLSYEQRPLTHSPYDYSIECADLVWGDADDALALLDIVAANRPFGSSFAWWGPPDDPLRLLLGDARVAVEHVEPWMLRLVDLAAALTMRGYPPELESAVALTVSDPLLPANTRTVGLEVAGGRGAVMPLASAGAQIDVGALAALYSGHLSARDLARLGRLRGAEGRVVAELDRIFGGPRPWMMDQY